MKRFSGTPALAGGAILVLLSFLFFQAQRVDSINTDHAKVLAVLHEAQRLDDALRQGVMQTYYEKEPNFDELMQRQRSLSAIIEELRRSPYDSFRTASTGVEYYMNRLVSMQSERGDLLNSFMHSVVLLKNAETGIGRGLLIERLQDEEEGELAEQLIEYQRSLMGYIAAGDEESRSTAEDAVYDFEELLYELEDRELEELLVDALQFSFQHGQILLRERVEVERVINLFSQVPMSTMLGQVMDAYLAFHEQQERIAGYYRAGLFLAGALLLVFLVGTLIRLRRTANTLMSEKEVAEVTLGSIGDAVLSTDREGLIQYLNRAAEKLVGYQLKAVQGKPLSEVLPLYSEITNKLIDDPARRAIEDEETIEIAQHIYAIDAGGHKNHLSLSASPLGQRGGLILGSVLVIQDVDESRALSEQLHYETSHDALTGLYNRMTFAQKIQHHLGESEGKKTPVLWHIDLDHFSVINDICGAKGGDGFLRLVAGELKRLLDDSDLLARTGGDEFAVLRPGADASDALNLACQIREAINSIRFEWDGDNFDTTATIGVVFINENYLDLSDVFMAAKSAIDTAREQGRNNIHIHTKDVYESSRKHELSLWVPKIKKALDEGRYRLYVQSISPITDNGCSQPHHAEVLLRMETEDGRILPPIFIPAAEEYNLMPQLDRWVIGNVCANIAMAKDQGSLAGRFNFSVNLSGTTLADTFFLDYVRNLFDEFAIDPKQICFEITETAAIQNLESAVSFIEAVRQMGCKFALDDFGSGMSSFAYLKSLPVDYLKIDGAFVKQLARDPVQYSIVEAVNKVGKTLKMETIAEFVEDDEIVRGLCDIGVDYAQGYGIDAPRPWEQYFVAQEEAQGGA